MTFPYMYLVKGRGQRVTADVLSGSERATADIYIPNISERLELET